jgi:hypothetical protein
MYQAAGKERNELQRLHMSSSTTNISVSMDALVKPVQVVDNLNSNKATLGAVLFVCADAGHCIGYYSLGQANATSEREPELRLLFDRHRDQGLLVSALKWPGIGNLHCWVGGHDLGAA